MLILPVESSSLIKPDSWLDKGRKSNLGSLGGGLFVEVGLGEESLCLNSISDFRGLS